MLAEDFTHDRSHIVYSGVINKTSPNIDILTVLTGAWDERTENGWHIVMTPFFTVFEKVVSEGSEALPYRTKIPVPGMLFGKSGNVTALVIRPGDDAVVCTENGLLQVQVFGDPSKLERVQ